MTNQDYIDADCEVIGMVNRAHGGRLPSKTLTFIPTERVEKVEKLDLRIRQAQKAAPYVCAVLLAIVSLIVGRMM